MQPDKDNDLGFDPKVIFFSAGAGILSALLAISLMTGSGLALILAYLAPFPLFLVGLGNGGRAALIAVGTAIVFSVLTGGLLIGCIYAVTNAFPAWLAIRLLLTSRIRDGKKEWFPVGNVLVTFSGYGSALFVLALALLVGDAQTGLVQMVKDFLSSVLQTIAFSLDGEQQETIVEQMYHFFPAMVLISWMLMTVINAVLAQGVLMRSGKSLRPSPKYSEMTLPDFASWLFIGCAALSVIGSGDLEYVARNLTALCAVPFLALGLTVVHKALRRTKHGGALIVAFYVLLLMSVWVALPVIGLGLIEQWIGLRHKIGLQAAFKEND